MWQKTFDYFQSYYLQVLIRNSWTIRFSALGSALEHLAYAILVVDQDDEAIKQDHALLFNPKKISQAKKVWKLKDEKLSVKRLQLLLERIGLTEARKHNDTEAVKAFVHLRNDAVHSEKLADLSPKKIAESFSKALQWLEEALL